MQTLNYSYDEEKVNLVKGALKNYFTLHKLVFVEDSIEGETGWSWVAVIAERKNKEGKLKNHLTTVTITKLSDFLMQVSYGRDVKITKILKTVGAGAGWFLVSPLGPFITIGIIGGVITAAALTSRIRTVNNAVKEIIKSHLELKEIK